MAINIGDKFVHKLNDKIIIKVYETIYNKKIFSTRVIKDVVDSQGKIAYRLGLIWHSGVTEYELLQVFKRLSKQRIISWL